MSTNSTITVRISPTERKEIYCHWDGYPSNNGKILMEHYNTLDKVLELIELGNLSALRERVAPRKGVHTFSNPQSDVCIAYGRDRGEEDQEAVIKKNSEATDREEYNYLFKEGVWYCNGRILTEKRCNK